MMTGVDDSVILPEQLAAAELRDLAELVVDLRDDAALIGNGDNRGLIERIADLLEPEKRIGVLVHRCSERVLAIARSRSQ